MNQNNNLRYIIALIAFLIMNINLFGQNNRIIYDDSYKCTCNIDSIGGLPVYKPLEDDNTIEETPKFIGGDSALTNFLTNNIKKSTFDSTDHLPITVYTIFIIDTSGNVSNICLYKRQFSNGYSKFEKEAMRVISIMPKYTPCIQNGNKVPIMVSLPIKFMTTK